MKNIEKSVFADQNTADGFIKTTDSPVKALTSEQKVFLNRKGNSLFNEGKITEAKRLFLTTGYSDGLTRVGDVYLSRGDDLSALKLYWLAHNEKKYTPIIKKMAQTISLLLN